MSDLKLPDIPDLGAIINEAFIAVLRKILLPIVNFSPSIFGYGSGTQPVRFAMGKFEAGKNLLNFVDETGSFAPQPPSRSAESIQQSEIDRFLRMGNTVVQMNGGNTNNSSTQVVANRDTQVSREMQALLSGQ